MAVLERMGKVEFVYSAKDRKTLSYKMSRLVAERERQNSVGKLFSSKYYESFNEPTIAESRNGSSPKK